ncbi:hypothetical protein ACFTT0_12605 [Streptomyces bauhiniae]|uniref:hypothetical protein n=1 Tax=Streptomyces bauhiniae TaxID=2340725 RepID=UPI00364179C2
MQHDPDPLFTQRNALILLLSALVSLGAGSLIIWSGHGLPEAVLYGAGSFGGAVCFFKSNID